MYALCIQELRHTHLELERLTDILSHVNLRLDEAKGSAEKPKEAKEDVEVRVGRKRPRLTMQLYNVIANRSEVMLTLRNGIW